MLMSGAFNVCPRTAHLTALGADERHTTASPGSSKPDAVHDSPRGLATTAHRNGRNPVVWPFGGGRTHEGVLSDIVTVRYAVIGCRPGP
jgi:hypothetical protein